MRAYVSANAGSTATAARKIPYLTQGIDLAQGISMAYRARFIGLLDAIKEIALAAVILASEWYRSVQVSNFKFIAQLINLLP